MLANLIEHSLAVIVRSAAAIFLTIFAISSVAQDSIPGFDPTLVRSDDWEERSRGFANLLGFDDYPSGGIGYVPSVLQQVLDDEPSLDDQRKLALITLLESENTYQANIDSHRKERGLAVLPVEERLTEDYLNYHGDLVSSVSYIKDKRGLNALLGVITTGTMVQDALVSFGLTAVGPVTGLLDNDDEIVRASSTLALLRIFEQSTEVSTSAIGREAVKNAAVKAALDNSPIVRRNAVRMLAELGDADSVAVIENLAKSDPYRATYREGSPYIVREAAIEALNALR